jgi:hypothetical protein
MLLFLYTVASCQLLQEGQEKIKIYYIVFINWVTNSTEKRAKLLTVLSGF